MELPKSETLFEFSKALREGTNAIIEEYTSRLTTINSHGYVYTSTDLEEIQSLSKQTIDYLIANTSYVHYLQQLISSISPVNTTQEAGKKDLTTLFNQHNILSEALSKLIGVGNIALVSMSNSCKKVDLEEISKN